MNPIMSQRTLAGVALAAAFLPWTASAQPAGVDPQADVVLRSMSSYIANLKQFSARTENTLEIVTTEGQKIQFSAPATITVARPDKLRADRHGDIVDQSFYYDGKSLTLFNSGTKHYATVPAPANVDAMLDFARTQLDVIAPGADLIDTHSYDRLMQDVTAGRYLGLALSTATAATISPIGRRGRLADLGSRGQATGAVPLRDHVQGCGRCPAVQRANPQIRHGAQDHAAEFRFVPPAGAKTVEFLPLSPSALTPQGVHHENFRPAGRRRITLLIVASEFIPLPGCRVSSATRRPSSATPMTPVSVAGVARRTAVRTTAVVATEVAASSAPRPAQTSAASAQAAAAQAAAAKPPAPAPAPSAGPLAVGTVVGKLPNGCVSAPISGVEYYLCNGTYYRAAFQGNNLVYVVSKP